MKTGLAQNCTGSLGDPIINVTYGSGTNVVGAPLSNTITNYQYSPFDCVNDDHYSILNKSSACHGSVWHTFTDHTDDGNGYFMLVNGSAAPRNFYVGEVHDLCPGATFQFAAWIMNVCNYTNSISPRLLFTVEQMDGTVLSSYATGDVPVTTASAVWRQYALYFTVPAGVSDVVLRISNVSIPSNTSGIDLALDDITFQPAGPATKITTTDFSVDTTSLCLSDTRTITFHSSVEKCYATTGYQWQESRDEGALWTDIAGANGPDYTCAPFPSGGTYRYRLSVAQAENIGSSACRVSSNQFKIIVYEDNARTISINKTGGDVCEDAAVTFTANTTYAGDTPSFQWMLNNQPVVNALDSVFTTSNLSNGDRVTCYFKSSLICNSDPLTSNAIPVTVLTKARSTVDTAICEGENYGSHTTTGIYTDAFLGSNGCDSLRTVNLVIYPKQYSSFDTAICYGTSFSGLATSGTYSFHYPSVHGCDSTHTIHLTVLPDINAQPHRDTLLCTGTIISLSPGAFDTYKWQDGAAGSSYRVIRGGNYSVDVTTGCGAATKTFAVEEKQCVANFPNAFTPNGDGRNDLFRVVNGYDISTFHFVVFSRWGQKVFETSDSLQGWDGTIGGKPANAGVYLWFGNYINRSKPEDKVNLKGTVVLMR